jgi:hypothetical protein
MKNKIDFTSASILRQILAGPCRMIADTKTIDLIITLHKGMRKKKGDFSIKDIARIQCDIDKKYSDPPKEQLI